MFVRNGLVLILSFIFILGIGSCKKDDDEVDQQLLDQQIIEEYIAEKNLTTTKTESGLHYIISNEGDDHHPHLYSYIVAIYKGYYTDGVVFDDGSNEMREYLYKLIPGWQEGIPLIGEGGKIKLIVPSDLAYGVIEIDSTTSYSVLVFDVELLQVYDE